MKSARGNGLNSGTRLLHFVSIAAGVVALAAACGASSRNPAPATGENFDMSDGGDCAERERVRPLCRQAMTARCEAQMTGCETSCEARNLPGNSEKGPALRGDMETSLCRDSCRNGYQPCLNLLVVRCPTLCALGE
jgi:hypothetical protein